MKYVVSMLRKSYAWHDITVSADSEAEAKAAALDISGDFDYSERDCDYSAEEVRSLVPDQAKYLAQSGSICPNCGSDNIEAGRIEPGNNGAWCEVSCHSCNATWTDDYTLVGFADFKEGS